MSNPPHPPIPPGCEYFAIEHYFYFVFAPRLNHSWSVPLCNPGTMRPIIAAVARCAWLDEANRLTGEFRIAAHRDAKAIRAAKDNARAWAAWGKETADANP